MTERTDEPPGDPLTDPAAAIDPSAPTDEEILAEMADDFSSRLRHGACPKVEDYVRKYPRLAERIRTVIAAIALIEDSLPCDPVVASEQPGSVVGRYTLLERIGEGGFGIVFMAEQQFPVRRKVALKLIKAGLDTKQVIARFEAERQALALMDHENIAKVFEAGATETGRPYFVMELVHGVPITQYCDANRLSPRQRLKLFIFVCRAVQHAHTKGIIHRDLKPTNVLVTMNDGVAVPKVIDFGVAKATGQQPLTDQTLFTQFAQIVGTPLYMSPEQAEMTGIDVDTRSDVYSLGVLLYELLTGTTPFEKERLRQAAHDEVRRIIREEDPPRPSTRISTFQGEKLATVSADRKTDARRLGQLVRGELDWIVMKALEKDRTRRYETANGLAMDVQRYLSNETVHACPPTAGYRLRKFVRRNRAALAAATLIAVALLLAAGGITWAVLDRAARDEQAVRERSARQARITGQLESILEEVARLERAEKWHDALVAARRADPALATGEAAPDIQHQARQALDELELVRRVEEIRAQSGTVWGGPNDPTDALAVRANQEYMAAFQEGGIDVDTLPLNEAAARIMARSAIAAALVPAMDDWVAVRSKLNDESAARRLRNLLTATDRDPWRQQVRDALARRDWAALESLAGSPELERQPAATCSFLSAALCANAKYLIQIEVLRRIQWKYPADFWINHRLGTYLVWVALPQQVNEGIGYLRAAVALRPQSSGAMVNLGSGYFFLQEYDQAIACYRKAIELRPTNAACYTNLAIVLGQSGQHEAAVAAFEQSIKLRSDAKRDGFSETYAEFAMVLCNRREVHLRDPGRAAEMAGKAIQLEPNIGSGWSALGAARYRQGEWEAARAALNKSLELGGSSGGGPLRSEESYFTVNWLFLAMSSWQLGLKDEARLSYRNAIDCMERDQPNSQELLGFRAEAAEVLGLSPRPASRPATSPDDAD